MMKKTTILLMALAIVLMTKAENGHNLWLRNTPVNKAKVEGPACLAAEKLHTYYQGQQVSLALDPTMVEDAYRISGSTITAKSEIGLLYGAFALLRGEQGYSAPYFKYRILNHWDNLDGSIERGYAGRSIFWDIENEGPKAVNAPLIEEYAIANASVGINGTVLNNVNASPKILSAPYIKRVKEYADIMRPYGIRVYLSVNFASPMSIPMKGINNGKPLKTADPLNAKVKAWWKAKAKEIYQQIPDFGGFLVKANSEGQPGPFDYNRTHADGANMLADAVAPYNGIVMWRSFVYGAKHKGEDRVKQAVSEFKDLDGKFRSNVILQSKNGPLDFQPREPYAPIFDNISQTKQMAEAQILQIKQNAETQVLQIKQAAEAAVLAANTNAEQVKQQADAQIAETKQMADIAVEETKQMANETIAETRSKANEEIAAANAAAEEARQKAENDVNEAMRLAEETIASEKQKAEAEIAQAKEQAAAEIADTKQKAEAEIAEAKELADIAVLEANENAEQTKKAAETQIAETKQAAEGQIAETKQAAETQIAEMRSKADEEIAAANAAAEEARQKAETDVTEAMHLAEESIAEEKKRADEQIAQSESRVAAANAQAQEAVKRADELFEENNSLKQEKNMLKQEKDLLVEQSKFMEDDLSKKLAEKEAELKRGNTGEAVADADTIVKKENNFAKKNMKLDRVAMGMALTLTVTSIPGVNVVLEKPVVVSADENSAYDFQYN